MLCHLFHVTEQCDFKKGEGREVQSRSKASSLRTVQILPAAAINIMMNLLKLTTPSIIYLNFKLQPLTELIEKLEVAHSLRRPQLTSSAARCNIKKTELFDGP